MNRSILFILSAPSGAGKTSLLRVLCGLTLPEMITYVAVSWIGRSFYFNNIHRELSRMMARERRTL